MFSRASFAVNRPGLSQRMATWRQDSDSNWFDGSVWSVDQRLAKCDAMLHSARRTVADLSLGDSASHLAAIQELTADREALASLRHDLLTAATDRESPVTVRNASRHLTASEHRWVTLESAKFLGDNLDAAHYQPELAERAQRHAATQTSTLSVERSQEITAAFVEQVVELGRRVPRPRTASYSRPPDNLPSELLFL